MLDDKDGKDNDNDQKKRQQDETGMRPVGTLKTTQTIINLPSPTFPRALHP